MLLGRSGPGSLLRGGTVQLAGPSGFVGLCVPHLIRTRVGADHRVLMPCAFLGGGVLLATCDAIGRVVAPPSEVPAGAIMAMIGGPSQTHNVEHVDSLEVLVESFADAVEGRAPFPVSTGQMLDLLGAFEAILASLETRAPAHING